ncbi:hypothetical protein [Acinetobacter sp. TSRC1-2]|uniref:hypothetical protein n=1 Tax=unclassified Acinetobacter TaxID=196816 RepID=UPI003CE6F86B
MILKTAIQYRFAVLYRFIIAFLLGYACTALLASNLTVLLNSSLPKAEAIYLAAFISILFCVSFVISSFCIRSLHKLSFISISLAAGLSAIYWIAG